MGKIEDHWQSLLPPDDIAENNQSLWDDIVKHGAETAVVSDDGFADARTVVRGVASQFAKKPASSKASKAGVARQKQGASSEKRVRRELERMGIQYIARIKTYYSKGGRYAIKAEADFRGIGDGGRYVLVEAKDITDGRLVHSRIAPHQLANLDKVVEAGGIALLAITNGQETAVLAWPVDGFEKGTSILWADALEQRINK